MTAPILLPDVHKRSEATSRPQNFTRSHLSPKINADQGGVEPPTIEFEAFWGAPRLQRQRHIHWATGPVAKKGPSLPSQHPQKATSPHNTPAHRRKKQDRPRHFRLLPHVGAEKLARAIQHTAVARNRAALATSLLADTLADKQVAACIHNHS